MAGHHLLGSVFLSVALLKMSVCLKNVAFDIQSSYICVSEITHTFKFDYFFLIKYRFPRLPGVWNKSDKNKIPRPLCQAERRPVLHCLYQQDKPLEGSLPTTHPVCAQGSSSFCDFLPLLTDSFNRKHKQTYDLNSGIVGRGDVFNGILRFKGLEN